MEHISTSPIPIDELLAHRAWVRNLARSLVRDEATVDDVEQQTWLAALRRPPSERATVRAWFATVVRNSVRERGRAEGRRDRREIVAARPEGLPATAAVVARAESHKRLVLAVMDLSEPYRETVLLRFFEGLPPRTVAARMDVPVETVRTRTRRGIALLRDRLDDEERGDRGAWQRALAPLVLPLTAGSDEADETGGSAPESRRGGNPMVFIKWAAVAAVLIAVPLGAALFDDSDSGAGAVGGHVPAGDEVTTALAAGEARGNRRRIAPPPVRADEDVEEAEEEGGQAKPPEGTVWGPPMNPLPADTDASVYANGKLVISLSVDPPQPRAGEGFAIVTTFRNVGTGPARFHIPEFAGTVAFPRITLRAADGRLFTPVPPLFQSDVGRGLVGQIVRLEAGEAHRVASHVAAVAEISPEEAYADAGIWARSQKAHDLLPGDFTLAARHANADTTVPYTEVDFGTSRKEVAGLWTGELSATEITMRLGTPNKPMLTLHAPEKLVPGAEMTVSVVIANPSTEERTLRGAFRIWRAQKGSTPYAASFELGDGRATVAAPNDDAVTLLAPGESRTVAIDLGEMLWTRLSGRRDFMGRVQFPWGAVFPAVWVTCGAQDDEQRLGSNTLFVSIEAAPDLSESGLRLGVDTDGLLGDESWIGVHLVNDANDARAVPRRMRTSRRLLISLEPVGETRRRHDNIQVADGEPYAPLTPDDVVLLGTGEEVYARVELSADWRSKIAPGRYLLRAHWASLDGCKRDGFGAAQRPVVGRLSSESIEITVPEPAPR